MAILTPDYERMQDGQSVNFETTKEYRNDFKSQDIGSAQALITSDNDYLVMDADKLNDLCDTINYMQQIWEDDKRGFILRFFSLTESPEQYNGASRVYTTGALVLYNGVPYICIANDGASGDWDDSKWLRIGNDDVGLVFAGQYDPLAEYSNGVLVANGETGSIPTRLKLPVTWEYKMNDSFTQCGTTYPNIRYLTSSQTPYTGEIYMTDWNGGEE